MKRVENLNAPSATGWVLAIAAGFVAFAVAKVVGGFDYFPSAFFGALVALPAGLVLGMPWGGSVAAPVSGAAETAKTGAAVAPVAVAVALEPAPSAEVAPSAVNAEAAVKAETVVVAPKAAKAEAAAGEATKPKALKAPRKGGADDLKQIEGIGPALEKLCNELGIYHFDQIAGWGEAEVAWMDANLKGFKGRVTRDKWVAQTKLIGEVGMDEFLRRAKTNDY